MTSLANTLRILASRRPKYPPGTTFVSNGADGAYRIYVVPPGQVIDATCKPIGPAFSDIGEAGKYRDWLDGGPAYRYPVGRV